MRSPLKLTGKVDYVMRHEYADDPSSNVDEFLTFEELTTRCPWLLSVVRAEYLRRGEFRMTFTVDLYRCTIEPFDGVMFK